MMFKLIKTQQVSSKASHSAFCDLLYLDTGFVACYRQATNHISGDGRIETRCISEHGDVSHTQHLWLPGVDLRDPKLSRLPDGRLLLIAYARHNDAGNKTRFAQSMYWTSVNGQFWSSPRYFGPKNWWLWRLRWHKGVSYGFAYNRRANAVDLYAGNPLSSFSCIAPQVLSQERHGWGYPNESDLWFDADGSMHAIIRRDADSYSAIYGHSQYPYRRWQWTDLHTYVGGPNIAIKDAKGAQSNVILGGRVLTNRGLKTGLWQVASNPLKLHFLTALPSAGDNSYPGMVWRNNALWVLYYSSHIDQQSRVYLAKLEPN